MAEYALADEAEIDLLEIGRYTLHKWGLEQVVRYLSALDDHFTAIAGRDVYERAVFEHRDDFRVSRCRHHYVFFVREKNGDVLVLAVLHENMDMIARLRERLGMENQENPPAET
jgi:plasmid stabilization system protein ParE